MKVLLTGSAGFIGFHTALRLLERGDEVIGFDNFNPYYDATLKERRNEILEQYEGFHVHRADLVDEQALADALNSGRIAGAGLDVLAVEPPEESNPLLRARNCYITPHIAWATRAARKRLLDVAVDNVAAFLAGKPQNVVNGRSQRFQVITVNFDFQGLV